ncbi:uncharacterized protein LOC142231337 [Haematobia irritans]|uniref:uncharacterized protein LOC142231337 n=1 Tax=Haematobia irritans TaxID=7368 RepID=UPI003F50C4B7
MLFDKVQRSLMIFCFVPIMAMVNGRILSVKPDFLNQCQSTDPDFNECFRRNFQALFTEWNDDESEVHSVGALDPIYIKDLNIDHDLSPPVSIHANLHNLEVRGLGSIEVERSSFDIDKLIVTSTMVVPKLNINSDYSIKGRILSLPLNGHGKSYIRADHLEIKLEIGFKLRDEDGFTFADVDEVYVSIKEVGGFGIRLDNLFHGHEVLEESANAVFNDNWHEFYEILRPAIKAAIQSIMTDRLSKLFSYIPITYFIRDIPAAANYNGWFFNRIERTVFLAKVKPGFIENKMNFKIQFGLFVGIVVTLTTAVGDKYLAEKPDFFTPCKLQDPAFNRCFAKNFEAPFSYWNDGLPGLKTLGPLDPFYIKRVAIAEDGNGPAAINIGLTNLEMTGLKHTVIEDASFNPAKSVTKVQVYVPKVNINADYSVKGRVLTLPLDGNGKARIVIKKLKIDVAIRLKGRKEDGFFFTDIDKIRMDINDVGGFQLDLDNLFNGQKVLEETANRLFNDNWRDLYEVMKPSISATVEKILDDRFRKIFSYVPANYFIENIEEVVKAA